MKTNLNGTEIEVVSLDGNARLVFGTRTEKWYLVGSNDRDYAAGIPEEKFKAQSEAASRAQYLAPTRV
jgi:hypothetical protein